MPPAATAPAIKLKNSSATPPPEPAVAPPVPALPPLEDALERLHANRVSGRAAALRVYRGLALKLADGHHLADAEAEAIAHAMDVLDVKPSELQADVEGVRKHRLQVGHAGDRRKEVAELEPQEKTWGPELERLQARKVEIAGLRAKLDSLRASTSQHEQEAGRLAHAHFRVLGDIDAAIAKVTAPADQTGGGPKVIPADRMPGIIRNDTPPAFIPRWD